MSQSRIQLTAEQRIKQLNYIVWVCYTMPIASAVMFAGCLAMPKLFPDLAEPVAQANTHYNNTAVDRKLVLIPAYVRCVNCGAVHTNSIGIADPLITQCSRCELSELGTAKADCFRMLMALRDTGYYSLCREDMLQLNSLAVSALYSPAVDNKDALDSAIAKIASITPSDIYKPEPVSNTAYTAKRRAYRDE